MSRVLAGGRAARREELKWLLSMPEIDTNRLLLFARTLQRAASFTDLLNFARDEARASLGYSHVWLMVADSEPANELRLIEAAGERREALWDVAPVLSVRGDAFLEALLLADEPVVILDARVDPRTDKAIVERLQNRTIINVPLRVLDKPFGIFGLGTFGDEGCRAISEVQLGYLVGMVSQIAVAASRIRFLETQAQAQKERRELERHLLQIQKLESLGLLAGGIAHDFNNLLTVVMASAGLAQAHVQDPIGLAEIRAIQEAASRAGELTKQLLAMSRDQELSIRALDMNAQLRQILDLARRLLPETIRIDLIEGRFLPLVEGDPSQLDQVFMNLFVNARDAMPEGGQLTIETEQVLVNGLDQETHPWAHAGRYVLTTVTDTGSGMPRDVVERVFEPFFTTKGSRRGTGLGLAVSYGIIRQHRGMIHCSSEVGVGTSFKVYLPAAERMASAVGTKLEAEPAQGRESILVAEDDELVRGVAVRILEKAGYEVRAVEDGEAACRAVSKSEFDLVLLDVVMPGIPCREVVERILNFSPGTRILLSSGYTAGAHIASLTRRTGLELLRKPYDPDQMLRFVRSALDSIRPPPP